MRDKHTVTRTLSKVAVILLSMIMTLGMVFTQLATVGVYAEDEENAPQTPQVVEEDENLRGGVDNTEVKDQSTEETDAPEALEEDGSDKAAGEEDASADVSDKEDGDKSDDSAAIDANEEKTDDAPLEDGEGSAAPDVDAGIGRKAVRQKAMQASAKAEPGALLNSDAQYLKRASISSVTTGTAPFDSDDTPGNDSSADNDVVRTYDSLNYTISVVSEGYDPSVSWKSGYVWYRFVVPGSDSAQSSITDEMSDDEKKAILADEMEIDVSSMGWMTSNTETEYDYQLKIEKVDGKWSQVMYASNYLTSSSSAFPIALANVNLALSVKNMKNGDEIQPTIYTWIDYNNVDKGNWDPNYVDNAHKSAPNGGKELKKLVADKVKVSAAPKYNVQIKEVGTDWVGVEADFDFTTGNNKALNQDASNNAFGQLRAYGITVQLYNDSPSKGLKGIEMPKGPITFDMDIGATYTGSNGDMNMSGDNFYVPKIWSYDKNHTSATKQDERNISDYTSIYYARGAAPLASPSANRDKIRGTKDSGTWSATQNGSKVSLFVKVVVSNRLSDCCS